MRIKSPNPYDKETIFIDTIKDDGLRVDTSKAVKETVKTISTLTKGNLRIYDITQRLGNKTQGRLKDDYYLRSDLTKLRRTKVRHRF